MFKRKEYLVVHFDHESDGVNSICGVESQIKSTLADNDAGQFNCHEMVRKNGGHGEGFLYFDASDGKKLFNLIRPIVKRSNFIKNPKARVFNGKNSEDMSI